MTISKQTFVDTMNRLENFDKKVNAVHNALHDIDPHNNFWIFEPLNIIVNFMQELFNDKEGWIDYFIYELDFLHKYEPNSVLDKLSNPIDLSSWDKVYDFLIKNMKEV